MKKNSRAINSALESLSKRYGTDVVQRMDSSKTFETISTGRNKLDEICGGGFAKGKVIEIYGEEATGKTGLALDAVKVVQGNGGLVAYIDTEHALNKEYCEQIGVNIEDLLLSQPEYGEQAFMAIRTLIDTGEIDLVVVDSVASMIPQAELNGETGESKMGLHARMMSQGLKQIIGIANNTKCTVIFINQLRDTLAMYGASKKPTGGNSLKFYAAQRFHVKNKGRVKEGEDIIGFNQSVEIVKNKIAPPFKSIEQQILYGRGIDGLSDEIDAFVSKKILNKKGAWFEYEGTNIAQGIKKLRVVLEDNPDLLDELRSKL